MGLIPLPEWRRVDLDDGSLGQGVGTDEFVVGGVEDDTDDTGFLGHALGTPGEVARVETEGAVFGVATAGADEMDTLGADTGVGGLAAELEGALLAVGGAFGTGVGALVARITRDTHVGGSLVAGRGGVS